MSTYPVLNDQPIDQWNFTELKDELSRRNLPTDGLKDDLVKRLFEELQGDIFGGDGPVGGSPPDDDLKEDEAPGSADASVCQAAVEQNVDEGPSQVATLEGYPVGSVTEASEESADATTEVIQDAVVSTEEVSQTTLVAEASEKNADATTEVIQDAVVSTEEVSQTTLVAEVSEKSADATTEVSQDAVVSTEEVSQTTLVAEASEKSADATTEVSQDAVVSNEEVSQTTLVAAIEVSDAPLVDMAKADEISPSGAVAANGDHLESAPSGSNVVKEASPQADRHSEIIAEKTPEEGTIKKVIANYLPCDVASTDVKLDATSAKDKLDADIVEQDAVSSLPDASASHVDPLDVDAVAAAPGQNAETLIPVIDLSDNALMNGKDLEDSGRTNSTCKPTVAGTKDQVTEANPVPGSQIKCVLIPHDNISTNVKGDLNADNSDLQIEVKRDMVKPPCNIPSIGDDLQALDDDKELSKNGTPLQEIESKTNMILDKKEDSPDGAFPEKLNLDRSSMEEDVMESKHVDTIIRSDDLGGKTAVTSDHEEVKEVILFNTVANDSSVETMDIVHEEKLVTSSEKRKLGDQEVAADDPIKRQRHVDTPKILKQQTSKLSSSDSPKVVVRPALKHSVGRSDSTASGGSHKEQIVPLPQKPATTSLRVDRFVRPFTLKAVQELLGRTGSVCSFWMDDIKTHCYVTYSSVDEAVATRNAVYNLQWPLNNGSYLAAEFVDPLEVKLKIEHPPPPPPPTTLSKDTTPNAVAFQQAEANQTMLPHGAGTAWGLSPTPQPHTKSYPTSNPRPEREVLPPPPKQPETTIKTLDDLFRRTQASPMIYYLPLSEEEVSAKLAARRRRNWRR
ncbi:uncharacterized protein LOC119362907 [Triticum dicoccoides]|uniref:uncharacterized protein LOC119362907 n=1 Tax=Triticum dicoccoides TaxID=85692 RepID=UPI000E7C3275|nr:uncharacterized protein LOC119362907 [Triticum dicoccoides]